MQKITLTKEKYPTKRTINLAMNEYEGGNPRLQILAFAVFLVALAVFVKIGVIDRMAMASDSESAYVAIQQEIAQLEEQTADYDEVREQYSQYSSTYLSAGEAAQMDRMQVMDLLETSILTQADVRSVQVTGNEMTIQVENTNLDTVSAIVSVLQADERVATVNVTTAGNDNDKKRVSASFTVVLMGGAAEE